MTGHYVTVLEVVSDSGLWAVWIGFALAGVGTAWQLWLARPIARRRRRMAVPAADGPEADRPGAPDGQKGGR
jgi:hypothetical protein